MSMTPSTTRSSLPLLLIPDSVSTFDICLRLRLIGFATSCFNFGSSLRLLDHLLRAVFLGLEVIASVFLGATLIVIYSFGIINDAEVPNENHLIVHFA